MGKKKGKKRKQKPDRNDVLHEVDKTFYELQILDLNRKLARLRSHSNDLEEKVLTLEQAQNKTESDRADVIIYLKRTLQDKTNEAQDLQERVVTLETAQDSNEEAHLEEIAALKAEFESMREQLVSEIKLITGKLNALEEFRMQRDDLMHKFKVQENQFEEQEIRHKKNMYEVERKFILGKDAIKHEMEQQLFQLAKDFENANELRIAATTQRVIRENIVINNELNKLISTSEEFQKENVALKAKIKELGSFNNILEAERNKALKDYTVQKGVIHQMVHEIARMKEIAASQECNIERGKQIEKDLKKLRLNEDVLNDKIKVAEQRMHSIRCSEFLFRRNIISNKKYIKQLHEIIFEALYNFESLMTLEGSTDTTARARILGDIELALRKISRDIPLVESEETITSARKLYQTGDLGLVPKINQYSVSKAMQLHAESQVGPSFHDFLSKQKEGTAEETIETEHIPETFTFEYKESLDSSDESIFSLLTEISTVSSKENEKETTVSQSMHVADDTELEGEGETEEEEIREEEDIDKSITSEGF